MTAPLPSIRLAVSLDDLYAIYTAGVADGEGATAPAISGPLQALLTTLRGRYLSDHADELLHALDDAPAWLAAQQTLKERSA